jgi:hypothetical protein
MCQSLGNKPADWPSPILGRSLKKMVDRAFVREATGTARPGQTVRYGMDPASATEGRWKVQTKKTHSESATLPSQHGGFGQSGVGALTRQG